MGHRPWNPLGRDDSFYLCAVYVVVDGIVPDEHDVHVVRLSISSWPRICNKGHLHHPGETVTVFVDALALITFLGSYLPSLTFREGAVFYASRLALAPKEGERLVNLAAYFMRPLVDASDAARDAAQAAMYQAIHRDDASSSACDWNA